MVTTRRRKHPFSRYHSIQWKKAEYICAKELVKLDIKVDNKVSVIKIIEPLWRCWDSIIPGISGFQRRDLELGTGRNRLIRFTTGAGRRLRIKIRDRIKYKNQNHRLCRIGGSTISARQRIDLDSWQRGRKYSQWRYHQIQRARAEQSKNKRCWSFTSREIKFRGEIQAKGRGRNIHVS